MWITLHNTANILKYITFCTLYYVRALSNTSVTVASAFQAKPDHFFSSENHLNMMTKLLEYFRTASMFSSPACGWDSPIPTNVRRSDSKSNEWPKRLVTFETFDQSVEETWHGRKNNFQCLTILTIFDNFWQFQQIWQFFAIFKFLTSFKILTNFNNFDNFDNFLSILTTFTI